MTDMVNLELIFGRLELVSTQERRGSKIYMGGYSIRYDREGREASRTENTWNCVLDCGDAATAIDMERLSPPQPEGKTP